MIVKELIKQLMDCPMDAQVIDTREIPIMMIVYKPNDNEIRLEPKDQIDLNAELDAFIEQAIEDNYDDREGIYELQEMGYTLEDLKNYSESFYEWAKQYWD